MINALFVEANGVYFQDERIVPWDVEANAFLCRNGLPAICHPPCKRWGRYWSGGPSAKVKRLKGDDDGCFAFSLWYVRTFGGVIEHPEASHAWSWFGLQRPPRKGGWVKADLFKGWTCCVEQGHYGHKARKATWLYFVGPKPKDLIWGPSNGQRLDEGFHSTKERKAARVLGVKPFKRLSAKENLATPIPFKETLVEIVNERLRQI